MTQETRTHEPTPCRYCQRPGTITGHRYARGPVCEEHAAYDVDFD